MLGIEGVDCLDASQLEHRHLRESHHGGAYLYCRRRDPASIFEAEVRSLCVPVFGRHVYWFIRACHATSRHVSGAKHSDGWGDYGVLDFFMLYLSC